MRGPEQKLLGMVVFLENLLGAVAVVDVCLLFPCYTRTDIDNRDFLDDLGVFFQRVERRDHHVVEHAEPARRRRGQQPVRSRVMSRRPHAHERVPKLPVFDFLAGHAESLLHVRRKGHGLSLHELAGEFVEQLEVPQRVRLQNLLLPRDRKARVVAHRPIIDLRVEGLKNRGYSRRSFPRIGALRAGGARNVKIAVGVVQDDRAKPRMHAVEDLAQVVTLFRGEGCEEGKRGNLRLDSLLRRESGVWCW